MKLIWSFDENKHLVGDGKEVEDDYELKNGETDIWPPEGALSPIKFCGDHWEGITAEEWLASNLESQPSETDKQLAQLTYQQMMTTQDVTTLQSQNAQVAYQLMMMQKQGGEA